jgi:hypothetical protein
MADSTRRVSVRLSLDDAARVKAGLREVGQTGQRSLERRGRLYGPRQGAGSADGGADEMIRVYDLVTMQAIGEHRIDGVLGHFFPEGSMPSASSTTAGILHVGVDGFPHTVTQMPAQPC